MNGNILLVTGASSDVGAALIRRAAAEYDSVRQAGPELMAGGMPEDPQGGAVGKGGPSNKPLYAGKCLETGPPFQRASSPRYDKIICHYRGSTAIIENLQKDLGDKIVPFKADFADMEQTSHFIRNVLDKGLAPSHFVHLSSSSSSINVKFGKTDWASFEREINITFRSAVMCCRAFMPLMAKAKYGKVVFMLSSQMIWEPHKPYSTAYTCVKHALLGLMKSLSAEYMSKGVTVNGISPSMIDTKFLLVPDIVKEANAQASPIKRLLTVDDVVPAFEFLLSPGADTITGQNIPVTGGA